MSGDDAAGLDVAGLGDAELASRLDALRAEELRRLGFAAADPRHARFFQETEKLASLGVLARGLAHEFNNLFSGVIAHCDYALRSGDDEARTRALEVALASTRQAAVIVKNIQRFAREARSHPRLVDPAEAIARTIGLLGPSLKSKKVRLVKDLDLVPPFVMDAAGIEQVLLNLLTNALQASPKGGEIRLALRQAGGLCIIEVSDDGRGIDPEHMNRLFTPFFSTKGVYARTDADRKVAGTGLGLAVAYGIVRSHGGAIEVDSAPGKGATFRVKLPMATEAAPHGEGDDE